MEKFPKMLILAYDDSGDEIVTHYKMSENLRKSFEKFYNKVSTLYPFIWADPDGIDWCVKFIKPPVSKPEQVSITLKIIEKY